MTSFHQFLLQRIEDQSFATEDVLSAFLPLLQQVIATHDDDRVAPLDGIEALHVDNGAVWYGRSEESLASNQLATIRRLLQPSSRGVEVTGEYRITHEVGVPGESATNLRIAAADAPATQPVWVSGYRSWEHTVYHHDPLTDTFCLGQILASLACGLDLTDSDQHRRFVEYRTNLFAINPDLHPVLASAITVMTELDRHARPPQLPALLNTLRNYRDQPIDFETDLAREQLDQQDDMPTRRQAILRKLQERLFEINRRNRLLQFRTTMQTVNLTHASIPLLFDVQQVREDQILTWGGEFREEILKLKAVSLNKYLNFREAVYLPGSLDRIRVEARRDQTEYGFAQLRLIVCFLKWADLKSDPPEQYESPLLLLPVKLGIRKGIHDRYTLTADESVAEVNPVIRHLFRQLYDIGLPDRVDLQESGLEDFISNLSDRIQASDAAVSLRTVDRPRIDLVYEKAKRRLDQFRRRSRLSGRGVRRFLELDYSYESVNYHPLGVRLFEEYVKPPETHLQSLVSTEPPPPWYVTEPPGNESPPVAELERQYYQLHETGDGNPFNWEINLCSVSLANLKYRRMSLVRDYESLVTANTENVPFEAAFAVNPPAVDVPTEVPTLEDRYQVVACDPTQRQAIASARAGSSYIIQGPPGTGKSQTITNLIADFVSQGKRVLFVCEKRAAIDVVYHRLKQQSLDELCCLIHDSQADKKQFVMDLRQTSDAFRAEDSQPVDRQRRERDEIIQRIHTVAEPLQQFDAAMRGPVDETDVPLRTLLDTLIRSQADVPQLIPGQWERMPVWGDWHQSRQALREFSQRLERLQTSPRLADHPLRLLRLELLDAERPAALVTDCVQQCLRILQDLLEVLKGIPEADALIHSLSDLQQVLSFSVQARFLTENEGLRLLAPDSPQAMAYERHLKTLAKADRAVEKAQKETGNWKTKLTSGDTRAALEQARQFEKSALAWLKPGWWRLRSVLNSAYDFSVHAVKPAWSVILTQLDAEHDAQAARYEVVSDIADEFQVHVDFDIFHQQLLELRSQLRDHREPVSSFCSWVVAAENGGSAVNTIAELQTTIQELQRTLDRFLDSYDGLSVRELTDEVSQISASLDVLPDYLHCLTPLREMPAQLATALRTMPLSLTQLEAAAAERSLRDACRNHRGLETFDSVRRNQLLDELNELNSQWATVNGRVVREQVRQRFLERLQISSQPDSTLTVEERKLKRAWQKGRRELEHEFGKSMRYKAIRELAAGDSGVVVRDLKPVWLMSPLSVSDTLPLDESGFDVVIFDEASQITLEEAIPAVFRAGQIIVVGDEMQLPPTSFFSTRRSEDDDDLEFEQDGERVQYNLNSTSFLNQTARNMPSRMLGWHYRSRSESLISFSNHAFYHGRLLTVPEETLATGERQELQAECAEDGDRNAVTLMSRAVSFHFVSNGLYERRRNRPEAEYIAFLVRQILNDDRRMSVGIVAFSEAQQDEIDSALQRLAGEDSDFAETLEAEREREDDGQFNGLLVKNLENIQGDERDIIILSVCYGPRPDGRTLMNFGPINTAGGEKRLNVAFSRAKHCMALVSSIRSATITNDYNEGAACLKNYLRYAEAVSMGQKDTVATVLRSLSGRTDQSMTQESAEDQVALQLCAELEAEGWQVDRDVGQSDFRCDLAVAREGDASFRLGILIDTPRWYAQSDLLERELLRPQLLEAFGWKILVIRARDWYFERDQVLADVEAALAETHN